MSFLHTQCRAGVCAECQEIADEYEELLRNKNQALALQDMAMADLKLKLETAQRNAQRWEEFSKIGIKDVMQKWMDAVVAYGVPPSLVQTFDVLLAWVGGDISEGGASAILNLDRLEVRRLALAARERGQKEWESWRAANPPQQKGQSQSPFNRSRR